jgi:hypothetical protein
VEGPKSSTKVADVPLGGVDTTGLLERIDELTDEEVEHHLKLLEQKGQL